MIYQWDQTFIRKDTLNGFTLSLQMQSKELIIDLTSQILWKMTLITIMEWKFFFTQNGEKKKQSMDGSEEDKTYAIIPALARTKTFTHWVSHFKFLMKMMKSSSVIGFLTLILT